MMEFIQRCEQCCISQYFPGITLNERNICQECLQHQNNDSVMQNNKSNIEKIIAEKRGQHKYDVIVAYSAGKDSSFILYELVKHYELNVLAFMVDNNFVSERAVMNANTYTAELGVDLLVFKPNPKFMNNMYTQSLKGDMYSSTQLSRANAACLSCINLINNFLLTEAVTRRIPLMAGGYIEGQVPSHSGVVSMDNKLLNAFKTKNRSFLMENVDKRFGKYLDVPSEGDFHPVFINPMLARQYNEEEIIEIISQFGWKKPTDTGKSSSNCRLNDYAIAVHFKKYKFHPYEAEICIQVRRGRISKAEAMEKLEDIRDVKDFSEIVARLENV